MHAARHHGAVALPEANLQELGGSRASQVPGEQGKATRSMGKDKERDGQRKKHGGGAGIDHMHGGVKKLQKLL